MALYLHLDGLCAHADVHVDKHRPVLLVGIGEDEGSTVLAEVDPMSRLLWHRVAHLHTQQRHWVHVRIHTHIRCL